MSSADDQTPNFARAAGVMSEVAAVDVRSLGPIVGIALHSAHALRDDVAACARVSEADRLREEDPYTDEWTRGCDVGVTALRSRFEVDLNRARERAVYCKPADAWNLDLWHRDLEADVLERSLSLYDAFYEGLGALLDAVAARFGRFVVLDVHSYNHRRGGPNAPFDDPRANPVLNLGTGSMDRGYWAPVVDRFAAALARTRLAGRPLDVRENVRFKGGHLCRWVHARYPGMGCAIALEWKKVFMDEWTGAADASTVAGIAAVLDEALPALREGLTDGFREAR